MKKFFAWLFLCLFVTTSAFAVPNIIPTKDVAGGGEGSGGTEYTEGDTDASITGTAILWEDASDTLRPVSSAKPFPVEIISGAGSGGTASADDADFTAGTTNGTPAMGVYESTPTSVTDGDLGTVGITQGRRLKTSATIDAALPAGTNAIGKLAANSGVDIGDVDVTSIAAGDNNIGNVDIASIAAGDNNIGNVDVASIAAGDNNIGNVDLASAIPAGTNNIGDVDVLSVIPGTGATNLGKAEDGGHSSGDSGVVALTVRQDTAAALSGTDADYQPPITDALGRLWVRNGNPCADHARVTSAVINTASSGNVEIVALSGSTLIYVCGYSLVVDSAVDVQFIQGTGTACATDETDLTGPWGFSANGGITQANSGAVQFKAPAGKALCIENSGAVQVSGHVTYVQTAAA